MARNFLAGLLGADPNSPEAQGLLALGSSLLQASGPSTMPTSFGQALGGGLQNMQQARNNANQQKLMQSRMAQGQDPSSVQEWRYFNSLSPQDQARYLEMKRNPNMMNLGDRIGVRAPGGGIGESYDVGLRPGERPDVRGAQAAAELAAKNKAEAESALGSSIDDINKMRADITGLVESPGFNTVYGLSGKVSPSSYIPGTDAANSQARLAQLDAASFGMSIQKMKGMGSLSDAEGKKVAAAYTRATNPKISEEEARKAWSEVISYLDIAERRAYEKAGRKVPSEKPAAQGGGIQFLGFE